MAIIEGKISNVGQGVEGLTVVAFEEVRIGIQLPPKACQSSHPIIREVGSEETDIAGRFQLQFEPREVPLVACSFSAQVYVVVFDGNTLVWRSPKKIVSTRIHFDHELSPEISLPGGEGTTKIFGRFTICGQPASGYHVVAFEETVVGLPMISTKPCAVSDPSIRQVGSAVVDEQGQFEIRFDPTTEPPGACSFSSNVRVEVFDLGVRVWRSPFQPLRPSLRFDHELYPDCPSGSTVVRVTNDSGRRVSGAQVFANGEFKGITDELGQLFIPGLSLGDTLVARLRLLENETEREAHDEDSNRNWNYRVYITNLSLIYDNEGNNPSFQSFVVDNLADVQELVIRRRNTLVAFNLRISVEWDATTSELINFKDRLLETSELIYNATDGQFLIERLDIADNGAFWDEADIRIYANLTQASSTILGAIAGKNHRIDMNPYDSFFPGTFMHEMGHYAFYVSDEYEAGPCWPEGEPVVCTLASLVPGTPFSEGGSKDACPMRGAQDESRKKFCSGHPENPHVDCTQQGPVDCWSVIVQQYNNLPDWRLRTPVSRGVIVDLLPDSGVPMGVSTKVPDRADQAGSYISVADWKPKWHIRSIRRSDECPNLIVRVVQNGLPVNNAKVTLHTADGRSLYQGTTFVRNLADGTTTGAGEITVRGTHIGERIKATFMFGAKILQESVEITDCTNPSVISLPAVAVSILLRCQPVDLNTIRIDVAAEREIPLPPSLSILVEGEKEPFTIHTYFDPDHAVHVALMPLPPGEQNLEIEVTTFHDKGRRTLLRTQVATRPIFVDEDYLLQSADGAVELAIPEGAIKCPTLIVFEEALDIAGPELGDEDLLMVSPRRIRSTHTENLCRQALLHMRGGGGFIESSHKKTSEPKIELLKFFQERNEWYSVSARVNLDPLVATASIEQLGTYALVWREAVSCRS